jgi:ornithine cyclodeaminase/alanine dehydrogenase-like protein (mu-crystallin family)
MLTFPGRSGGSGESPTTASAFLSRLAPNPESGKHSPVRAMTRASVDPAAEHAIMRLQAEPCLFFDDPRIHAALMDRVSAFMDLLEDFYVAWGDAEDLVAFPEKQVFTDPGLRGDWRTMPCTIRNYRGRVTKAVKVIGTNEEERVIRDKLEVGKALLLHPTDNFVQAIFDVCAFSAFRTAAISVLAWKHCAARAGEPAGIVGTGRVGFYTAVILAEWVGARALIVNDTDGGRCGQFQAALAARAGLEVRAVPLDELARESHAIFLCTTSAAPLLGARRAGAAAFVSSVGADADNLSELQPDILEGRILVSDSRQNISFGDMGRWAAAGLLDRERIVELRTVVGRGWRPPRPVVFISTGVAVQDALVCQFLFDVLAGPGPQPAGCTSW